MENLLLYLETNLKEWGNVVFKIYPEAKTAIEKGWESLYFPTNKDTFVSLETDDYYFELETDGDVLISVEENGKTQLLRNKNESEIRKLINEGTLYENEAIYNNWFRVKIGKVIKRGILQGETHVLFMDEVLFEKCPKDLDELEKVFFKCVKNLCKNNHIDKIAC
ncbi:MAG: hypothetical protein K0R54_792 [Clostridiaceae bacterium]|jgi:hypothetical protein|nr:hypothetical protein [Clostridiaceae bacterium]